MPGKAVPPSPRGNTSSPRGNPPGFYAQKRHHHRKKKQQKQREKSQKVDQKQPTSVIAAETSVAAETEKPVAQTCVATTNPTATQEPAPALVPAQTLAPVSSEPSPVIAEPAPAVSSTTFEVLAPAPSEALGLPEKKELETTNEPKSSNLVLPPPPIVELPPAPAPRLESDQKPVEDEAHPHKPDEFKLQEASKSDSKKCTALLLIVLNNV